MNRRICINGARRSVVLCSLLAALLLGCADTQLVSSWQNPKYQNKDYKKVLVVAIGKQMDLRRSYEDSFVQQLQKLGVTAVPGYTLFPDTQTVSRETLEKAVADTGAQAVIITRLLKVEKEVVVTPGYAASPTPGLYGYYSDAWAGYYEPSIPAGFQSSPQVYEQNVATIETKVFDAKSQDVVWSGTTRTFEAQSWQREIPGLVKVIVTSLTKAGLV